MRRAFLILALAAIPAGGDDGTAYDKAVESTAWVCSLDKEWQRTWGSGVYVGPNYVLTANHVVATAGIVWLHQPQRKDGAIVSDVSAYKSDKLVKCFVCFADAGKDLALLKIVGVAPLGTPIPMASKSASPGEGCFAIGCATAPFGFSGGDVRSVYQHETKLDGKDVSAKMVHISAPINPGDSGGPILSRKGELLGIISHFEKDKNQVYRGIDITEIKAFLDRAREQKAYQP